MSSAATAAVLAGPYPDSPAGRAARWYYTEAADMADAGEDVTAHFGPEFRWPWGAATDERAVQEWVSRLRHLERTGTVVDDARVISDLAVVLRLRFATGATMFTRLEVEPTTPHRIVSVGPADGRKWATTIAEGFAEWTAVDGEAGSDRFTAEVVPPLVTPTGAFGGYLAAIALRAAGRSTAKQRPLSFSCHFVSSGKVGPVEIAVTRLRQSSRLESLRVDVTQTGALLLEALVWAANESAGPSHVIDTAAAIPLPADLLSFDELFVDYPGAFGGAVDGKPLLTGWQPPGDPPWPMGSMGTRSSAPEPALDGWVRLCPAVTLGDPWLDAARTLIPFDWLSVNATVFPHRDAGVVDIPSLDTTIGFHNLTRATEWLLCRASSPIAANGFATATATVWAETGELLAVAAQQVMHRVVKR